LIRGNFEREDILTNLVCEEEPLEIMGQVIVEGPDLRLYPSQREEQRQEFLAITQKGVPHLVQRSHIVEIGCSAEGRAIIVTGRTAIGHPILTLCDESYNEIVGKL
jgi:hypothetical protein